MFRSGRIDFVKRCIMVLLATAVTAGLLGVAAYAGDSGGKISRGVWVSVFSEKKIHFSKKR